MKSIYELFDELKKDNQYANLQLVLGCVKPACVFELYDTNIANYSLEEYKNLNGQDKTNTDLYWYLLVEEDCVSIFVVNRPMVQMFDYLYINETDRLGNYSCFESLLINGHWENNQDLFGIAMGYPLSVSVEFKKEVMGKHLRKDRLKNMFYYTEKDQIGFITYPEFEIESKMIVDEWAKYLRNQGIPVFESSRLLTKYLKEKNKGKL